MRRSWSRLALVLACLVASGATAATAQGAGWTTTRLPGEAGSMFLFGVDCPEADFCVATGSQNLIASSTDPTGGAAAWHVVFAGTGAFTEPPPGPPGIGPSGPIPVNSQVQGVSCPSSRLCVAVTNQGTVYSSTDPTGPASAWSVAELTPTGTSVHLYGVSCPTESLCVAVSGRRATKGRIFTSTDPTGGVAAWQEADLGEEFDLRAVSCSSATLCVAAGANGELVASRNPTGGAGAWVNVGEPGGGSVLQSIDCITGICLTGNSGGNLLTATEPTNLAGWHAAMGGVSVQITGSACASPSACLAVDDNGDVIVSTEPTGPHPGWVTTNVRPYDESVELPSSSTKGNALFGASCPSPALCVLVGSDGGILTSTEPFAVPAQAKPPASGTGKAGPPGKARRGPKRPRAQIVHLDLRESVPGPPFKRPPKAKALIRFHANGPVRRFECKLDKGAFRPCRSPKRYGSIPRGIHSIGVRAIGATGLRGPADRTRFYVGEICNRKGTCLGAAGPIPPGGGWKLEEPPPPPPPPGT